LVDPAASFEGLNLNPEVLEVLAEMGIGVPTPIQSQAIPALLQGQDVIGQARTGSGKTLAFGIPIVERCDPNFRGVQALILTPTRELAMQVAGVLSKVAAARRLWVTVVYGGTPLAPEREELRNGAQIVVGTPGRVLDHLWNGNLPTQDLKIFVLDEGDEMLDQGFAPDIERIISMIPRERQTALFSATVPQWVTKMAASHLSDPVTVRVDVENEAPPEIEQVVYEIPSAAKFGALCTLLDLRGEDPILVFGRTKIGVERLARDLKRKGYPAAALQGNLDQSTRERIMAGFRSGSVPILVATNVAARGLDVSGIEAVINYELPESAEMFTHRAGRTGRMGRQGVAITFSTPEDAYKLRQIERMLSLRLPRQPWPGSEASQPVAEGTHVPTHTRRLPAAAMDRGPRRGYQGRRRASQATA
jgi:ATP-dependent RNA helicase DeaD